ncbi:tail fiber protein [uncultured Desulfovibrio sp.]|uniref:tail fiber protein n=1 Tax=uncultured Desulfovibrio sp. TaxID=167968 RepID=UPI00261A9488|nr:tail fiber protein [uncultured Desulfovibrio sp.]
MAELYIRGKDGRPRLVGSTADPQLPGRMAALEDRMEVLETAPGGVPLSDAVDSASSTTAATSRAVKTAYDAGVAAAAAADTAQDTANAAKTAATSASGAAQKAQEAAETAQATASAAKTAATAAQTKANSAYTEATKAASTTVVGRVKLSDAVNSAVSTTAATSKAAKTAYDKAVAATFPAGTKLLFHQAAAPTGWTKQTTVNDATLRVVSGTTGGGTGGSVAFSTLFAAGKTVTLSGNVGATTLTTAQMPKHGHTLNKRPGYSTVTDVARVASGYPTSGSPYTNTTDIANTGGSTSHTHTLSGKATIALNVKYTDVIICAKA